MVIVAGPGISATTTRFEESNRWASGVSIHNAFCIPVRPGESVGKSSNGNWASAGCAIRNSAAIDIRKHVRFIVDLVKIGWTKRPGAANILRRL